MRLDLPALLALPVLSAPLALLALLVSLVLPVLLAQRVPPVRQGIREFRGLQVLRARQEPAQPLLSRMPMAPMLAR